MRKLVNVIKNGLDGLHLRTRLFWIILLSSLIPLLIMLFIYHAYSQKAIEKEIGSYTVEIARQANQQLDTYLEEIEQLADIIRFDRNVQNFLDMQKLTYDPSEQLTVLNIRESISYLRLMRQGLRGIFIVNQFEQVVYHAGPDVLDFNYKFMEQAWFQELGELQNFRLLPPRQQVYITGGGSVVTFAIRMTGEDGKSKGTLLMDLDPDFLFGKMDSVQLGETGFIFMLDDQGDWIHTSYPEVNSIRSKLSSHQTLQEQEGHFIAMSDTDEKMLVGYSTSSKAGWKVLGVVPFAEVATELKQFQYTLFWMFFLFAILIFIISTFISRAITKPLKKLESSMQHVEKGDFTIQIPVRSRDEIGRLSNKFNHMLKQLQYLKDEVYLADVREYKLELLSKESEIRALQAQVNPHFLYNTLNTMSCIGEVYEIEPVTLMSRSLAEMFQYSTGTNMFSSLDKELRHVQAYFQIIQLRYPGSFHCTIDVDETALSFQLPKLILQPLVENAVLHGLVPKEGEGRVIIQVQWDKEMWCITVSDDGVGMGKDQLEELRLNSQTEGGSSEHIGLSNVRQRLLLQYGDTATFTIQSEPNQGTTICIELPFS